MVFFHLWFDMLAFSWLVVHLRISVLWPRNWHFRHSIFLILRLCGCIFFVVSIHHFSLLPSQIMKRCTVLLFLFLILSHRFCLSLQSWKCMPLSDSLSLFIPLLRHCSPFSGLLSDGFQTRRISSPPIFTVSFASSLCVSLWRRYWIIPLTAVSQDSLCCAYLRYVLNSFVSPNCWLALL